MTAPTDTRGSDPDGARSEGRRALGSKAVAAVAVAAAILLLFELVPAFEKLRVFSSPRAVSTERALVPTVSSATGETVLNLATENRSDLAQPEQVGDAPKKRGPIAATDEPTDGPEPAPVPFVDEKRSLDRFFAALARTDAREPKSVTRILVFGDSVVASDFGTGTLRRLLQGRFGDAGHGFVLVANAWPQYFHNDVYRMADKGFRVSRIVGPRALDGFYGLGGVSFTGSPGLHSHIGTARTGTFGRSVSHFGIAYLAQPSGGLIDVTVDGAPARTIDTSADAPRAAFEEVDVADGAHELELRTAKSPVRLFGVTLERDVPGVVLDAVGIVGARIRTLDEIEPNHFAGALAWRKPNLVVYQFGANESGDGFAYPMPEYHKTMKELIERVGRALPDAGCLVIGAMDRARKENDRLVTVPIIPHIVDEQRSVAAEVGCAFFDTFAAMGGRGSMAKWVRLGFGAGDYTHPTSWGADKLGTWIYSALGKSYREYRERRRE